MELVYFQKNVNTVSKVKHIQIKGLTACQEDYISARAEEGKSIIVVKHKEKTMVFDSFETMFNALDEKKAKYISIDDVDDVYDEKKAI